MLPRVQVVSGVEPGLVSDGELVVVVSAGKSG